MILIGQFSVNAKSTYKGILFKSENILCLKINPSRRTYFFNCNNFRVGKI